MVVVDISAGSFAAPAPALGCGSGRPLALDLAHRLHDTVVQRLAGLSLLLVDGTRPFDPAERARCRAEVCAALDELRTCVEDTLGSDDSQADQLGAELRAFAREHPSAELAWSAADPLLDSRPDALVASVLAEGLRNARKHASPSRVLLDVARDDDTIVVALRNDGVRGGEKRGSGMGLRLLAVEASLSGALVESCPDEDDDWWRLSLILPAAA